MTFRGNRKISVCLSESMGSLRETAPPPTPLSLSPAHPPVKLVQMISHSRLFVTPVPPCSYLPSLFPSIWDRLYIVALGPPFPCSLPGSSPFGCGPVPPLKSPSRSTSLLAYGQRATPQGTNPHSQEYRKSSRKLPIEEQPLHEWFTL